MFQLLNLSLEEIPLRGLLFLRCFRLVRFVAFNHCDEILQIEEDPIHNFLFDNPVDLYGRPLNRALTCEYLTIAEFTSRLKDNFELGVVLEDLVTAVETHDSKHQMVTLVLAPCGYINVFSAPLVPDADMCMKLGQVHKNLPLLELNIDARD